MNLFSWILLIIGIIVFILLCVFFLIVEIISSVFNRLGFKGKKEDLYKITFKKFDFDYTPVSGTDNNDNQENLISNAIEHINTDDNPKIEEIDYYL